jgi:predicted CXXCH cytochrome family protein
MAGSLAQRLAVGVAAIIGTFIVGVLFLAGLAAKERDDRFCVACHLHDEKFERLTASSTADLAGLHHNKKPEIGCIACHGGADLDMRLRVWTVAGIDTLKFLVGRYREPDHMRLPLRDAECRHCHTPILPAARPMSAPVPATGSAPPRPAAAVDPSGESTFAAEAETEGRSGNSYHAIREHDNVRVHCVRCHASHTTDSDAAIRFISKTVVVPICRECHKQM